MKQAPALLFAMVSAALVAAPLAPTGPAPAAMREPRSGLRLIYLPAGSFHFGCEPQDSRCFESEKPGRTTTLPAFWLGETDVTVRAFQRCVAAGACSAAQPAIGHNCNWRRERLDDPMNCVDWEQARAFCAWMGGRLPTTEEWEYAAKGGESRIYPWGDQPPDARRARFGAQDGTAPVGGRRAGASRHGLLDMAGNVWQWTATSNGGSNRDTRGGGWSSGPEELRASHRRWYRAVDRYSNIGFRCARDAR